MTASDLKYDHDIIIKSAKSLKLFSYEEVAGGGIEIKICQCNIIYGKSFPSFPMNRKKSFPYFFFSICSTENSKFSFNVSLFHW